MKHTLNITIGFLIALMTLASCSSLLEFHKEVEEENQANKEEYEAFYAGFIFGVHKGCVQVMELAQNPNFMMCEKMREETVKEYIEGLAQEFGE